MIAPTARIIKTMSLTFLGNSSFTVITSENKALSFSYKGLSGSNSVPFALPQLNKGAICAYILLRSKFKNISSLSLFL